MGQHFVGIVIVNSLSLLVKPVAVSESISCPVGHSLYGRLCFGDWGGGFADRDGARVTYVGGSL